MTTHHDFYAAVETVDTLMPRLGLFLTEYRRYRAAQQPPLDVLDVGCGQHAVLSGHIEPGDVYHGVDVKPEVVAPIENYRQVDLNEDDLAAAYPGKRFDVIHCGEVIEHVFSPDRLLRQLASVMHRDSLLVVSTPNLAYWANRLLLLAGFSPLFVENSSEVQLGRRLKALGQGGVTQGHLRLFTHDAMKELVAREGFELVGVRSVPVWPNPIDTFVCRVSPRLAPNNVYLLRRPGAPSAR